MNSRRFMGFLPLRTDPCESEATRTGAEKLDMENGSVKAAQLVIPSSQRSQPSSECLDLDQWSAPKTNVRFGSKADIEALSPDVRFTPKSGHSSL